MSFVASGAPVPKKPPVPPPSAVFGVHMPHWVPPQAIPVLHALVIDLLAIFVLAFVIYYRRHRRADLLLSFVALNVGLFAVGILIVQQMRIGVAFGFGLFAILSIIRLRSDPIAPEESAYYFISLVLGLVNGMQFKDDWLIYVLDIAIVGVMFLLDNGVVLPRSKRQVIMLDVVHPDEQSLRADLEKRLNGKVLHLIVRQVDYVRDVTMVDVRLKSRKGAASAALEQAGEDEAYPPLHAHSGSQDAFAPVGVA